ncbi:MAG: hypothetical protein JJ959_10660 [Nisaea sp.]|uniref:hypothetical protein n=1 Tax=Nisaea sp. TaxID=2024842 RepID=UPI001B05A261|nr:hypothetical protein [Nisaea sp.]MBO6560992.1 hypothetical protein [Nisaea sp.]
MIDLRKGYAVGRVSRTFCKMRTEFNICREPSMPGYAEALEFCPFCPDIAQAGPVHGWSRTEDQDAQICGTKIAAMHKK